MIRSEEQWGSLLPQFVEVLSGNARNRLWHSDEGPIEACTAMVESLCSLSFHRAGSGISEEQAVRIKLLNDNSVLTLVTNLKISQ